MNLQAHLAYAQDQIHRDQELSAIETLKELLGAHPNSASAHALLALALVRKMRLTAADHEARLALSIDSNEVLAELVLAQIQFLNGRFEQAIEHCETALAVEPQNVFALLSKGRFLESQGRLEEGFACLEQALALEPESVDVLLAFASYHLGEGDHAECLRILGDVMQIDPTDADCHVLLGKLALLDGRAMEAREHARFAIMQSPEDQSALQLLADIKSSESRLTGVWWRWNARLSQLSDSKQILVLICSYLGFNLLAQIVGDLGYSGLSLAISLMWIGLVVYSWVGIPIYKKALSRELEQIELKECY